MPYSGNSNRGDKVSYIGLAETNSTQTDELLTIAEVAAYLKLSRRTAWRWCKNGQLPAVKVGHQWRVAQSDLEEFIQGRGNYFV